MLCQKIIISSLALAVVFAGCDLGGQYEKKFQEKLQNPGTPNASGPPPADPGKGPPPGDPAPPAKAVTGCM